MAKKPQNETAKSAEEDVIADVVDALKFNGEDYVAGDPVQLPFSEAVKLRALGVVTFEDPTPAA